MSWRTETRSRPFELFRHFLCHMVDGEWSSAPAEWTSAGIGLVSMLLPAGLLLVREGSLDPNYAFRYRNLAGTGGEAALQAGAMADRLALIVLLMCITGGIALLQWHSLFPSRRDYLALASLPVKSREIFVGRAGAMLCFFLAVVLALCLLPSLIAPMEFGGHWALDSANRGLIAAEFATLTAACLFTFFVILTLQGLLLNLSPRGWSERLASYAQAALIGVFLFSGLYSWTIKGWKPEAVATLSNFGAWLPPVWFLGLHESLAGPTTPFQWMMAQRAAIASVTAVLGAVALYLATYHRHRTLLMESPARAASMNPRLWSLSRLLAANPWQEAILSFLSSTLTRSRTHRLLWLAYLGGAAAVLLNSSLINGAIFLKAKGDGMRALRFIALFWPHACSIILVSGLRHIFLIPCELSANWIFRATENLGRKDWMAAVERFVLARAVLPWCVLAYPASAYAYGWAAAARVSVLQALVSMAAFELLFNGWQRLPFTCSYVPGKRSPVGLFGAYLAVLGVLVPILTVFMAAAGAFWFVFPVWLFAFGGVWLWLRRTRQEGWGDEPLSYESAGEIPAGIGIAGITHSAIAPALPASR